MIAQSRPWSTEAKTDRPAVNGLVSTLLVVTSGRRKLFQWQETEVRPSAR